MGVQHLVSPKNIQICASLFVSAMADSLTHVVRLMKMLG